MSLAALIAIKPGRRVRLIYPVRRRRLAAETGPRASPATPGCWIPVHQQLGGPMGVGWDNLNTRISRAMAKLIAARDWLTVCQLPPCGART